MSNLMLIDAAFPPPAGTLPAIDGICFYIGGDTPHVWSVAESNAYPSARYRLPIWVRSNPEQVDSRKDAADCLTALKAHGVPKGRLVALDSEMDIDAAWVKQFVTLVNQGGYPVIDYGSRSTVFGNQNPDGYYFAADWTGHKHLVPGSQMTQFVSFSGYDEDVAESSLPLWDTHATAPVPTRDWTEVIIMALPLVVSGNTSAYAAKVQGLLVAYGERHRVGQLSSLPIDSSFGPKTAAAVEVFQHDMSIGVDGKVGQQTWTKLLLDAS